MPIRVELEDEVREARCLNLSLGGVFLRLVDPPARGTVLGLQLAVPGLWGSLEVTAVVRWRTASGVGAQFQALQPYQVWCLGRVLDADARPQDDLPHR